MPELPEVETVRRGLAREIVGSRIKRVEVRQPSLRVPVDRVALAALVGREVRGVRRRAKYLLLDVDGDVAIVIHLGMSGSLVLCQSDAAVDKHDHVIWNLAGSAGSAGSASGELRFRDPRRFGLVVAVDRGAETQHRLFARLGVDPFEAGFNADYLWDRSHRSRRPIKNILMDATVVTGIGNIYASEALWRAAVNPRTAGRRISVERFERIRAACVEVLDEAIREGGTTLSDFRDAAGQPGYFAVRLSVYGREREACPRCSGKVRRIVQAGRSTFYCPRCQH